MTTEPPIHVLLVEDNPGDARLIAESLRSGSHAFALRTVDRLGDIRATLGAAPADVILLDLGLPDGQGLETFHRARQEAPGVPIVVLSGLSDQDVAIKAVREGAQDYLVKGKFDGDPLPRIVRHTVERRHADEALRRSEARFRAAVEASPDAFIILEAVRDASGRIIEFLAQDANTRAESLLALSRDRIIGRSLRDLLPNDAAVELFRSLVAVVETRASTEQEGAWPVPPQAPAWVHRQILPLGDGVALVLRDITVRRQMEEYLRHSQKIEAVGQLAAGVAHDFRNLLAAVQAHLAHARQALPAGHQALESLEQVGAAIRQASGIAGSLLTFTRKGTQEKSPVNLTTVVDQSVQLVRHSIPREIRIETSSEDPTLFVVADPTQLQQVVMNLAMNARDAMPTGGVMSIRVSKTSGAGSVTPGTMGVACLAVEDSGLGMTPEVQARIFEPYFTTKPRGQGTGLGLPIIHGIVEGHGGAIEVQSAPGKGSLFRILLPAVAPVEHKPVPPAPEKLRSALLIDGNPFVREVIASMLSSMHYEVLQAADAVGAERLGKASGRRFDLIVAAATVGDASGLDLVGRLRREGQSADAVVLCAGGERPAIDQPRVGVLQAPFRRADLANEIARLKPQG